MEAALNLIRILATALGAAAIGAPLLVAMRNARRTPGRSSGSGRAARSWPGMLLISACLVTLGVILWKPLPLPFPKWLDLALALLGAIFYFPGVGVYWWGLITLGPQYGVSSALGAELYGDHRLITVGPFAFVRHPMYAGVLLAALGALLIFKTWGMALFAPMSLVVIARAAREEVLLAEEFGEAWQAYAARVPKWFPHL